MLTKRHRDLINLLTKVSGWITANQVEETLYISVSTLRRDVAAVNEFFSGRENQIVSREGLGILLINSNAGLSAGDTPSENARNFLKSEQRGITFDLLTCTPATAPYGNAIFPS